MDQNNSHKSFGNSSNFDRQSEVNDNIVDNSDDNLMDVLDHFRENWRRELLTKTDNSFEGSEDLSSDVEMKAMELFKEGILLEQRGKLYDAVAYYRRATQLVPDIETKTYRMEAQIHSSEDSANIPGAEAYSSRADLDSDEPFDSLDDDCDLISRFMRLNSDEFGNIFICSPLHSTSRTHFSSLPFEVVLNILKWIITNELDMRSLEMFGSVCRGFYIASRDAELWRLSCHSTWGPSSSATVANYGNNWRNMFVEKSRPNFNGAYISRTTYIRQGEASFQDVHYRPCYLVEYYRYFRFFPNGHVLMLTTADDPHQSLPLLRHRKPKNNNVLSGQYRMSGQTISIVIKRDYITDSQLSRKNKNKSRDTNLSTQTFNISLDVKTVKNRRNHQLIWKHYSVHYKKPNGQEWANSFDLTPNKFPHFVFSRVKSYVSEAEYKLK